MTEQLRTTQLAALITAKQQVLEILVQLGRKQIGFITSGDTNSLLKLLAGKQSVISHLQKIEQAMKTLTSACGNRRRTARLARSVRSSAMPCWARRCSWSRQPRRQ
jgi:flagellar biosynthesis/type III secretory pathway chaperone